MTASAGPRRRTIATSAVAAAVRLATIVAIIAIAGFRATGRQFNDARAPWIALLVGAGLLTYPCYVVAYRSIVRRPRGPALSLSLVTRMVLAGFGPFALAGGFSVDREMLEAAGDDHRGAHVRVTALGLMELAVLAPLAWIASVALLVTRARVGGALVWPWAIGVPAGLVVGLWATAPPRLASLAKRWPRLRDGLDAIAMTRTIARSPRVYGGAWLGLCLYWAADIAALLGALRMFGLHPGIAGVTVAYATGYVFTRRSLPLGGAGLTEALLAYAVYQLGEPLAATIAAVVLYRAVNFTLVVGPAALAYRDLRRRLDG